MTYRERREARAERLRDWAEKRQSAAAGTLKQSEKYRGDHAFNTQPGHIPERARLIAREDRAFESIAKANGMESRAAGIERQLERSIYSDDPDALEQLEAKALLLDAAAERDNAINKAWRKARRGSGERTAPAPGWSGGLVSAAMEQALTENAMAFSWTRGKGPMNSSYARANARRARQRIEEVKTRQAEEAAANSAGGFLITRHAPHDWVTVRFSEQPDRAVIVALKGAGFGWSGGQWSGMASQLPAIVLQLEAEAKS